MSSREMTDNCDMEGVQDDVKDSCSPPRKKITIDDQAAQAKKLFPASLNV